MSSDNFRLESFRPWNPHEQLYPLPKRLDTCRYPSPVSLIVTPPPAIPTGPTRDPTVPVSTSKRHPLPTRPPAEVCMDGGPKSATEISRQPETVDQVSPVNDDPSCLDLGDILHLRNLPGSENLHDITFDHMNTGFEPRANTISDESDDLQLAFSLDQNSVFGAFEGQIQPGEEDLLNDATVDPAILGESRSRIQEQSPAEPIAVSTAHQAGSPRDFCPLSKDDGCSRNKRRHSSRLIERGQRSPKISKASVVIDNRPKKRPRRSPRGTNPSNASFPTIRAHFSALTAEDRLQFLSWLFEGTLSRCLPPSSIVADSSQTVSIGDDATIAESSSGAEGESMAPRSSRKGLQYSTAENRLLVKLKGKEKLAWSEVMRRFDQNFPGRSPASIQVHWCTNLSKRRSPLARNS
ncbi:unnamed protein product [Penicillium salamii]|nr:unnamed protein product [Penicillium salamii]CAG8359315.1 unnamed protein product [Penicillium salamii]